VKMHCTSPTRYTVNGDRIIASNKGRVVNGANVISMRWADGTSAEVAEMKVRYESCKSDDGYTGYAGDAVSDGTFNPANQGAPAPIGTKPDVVEDPRPGGAAGYDGPGFNGNGLDGMNVGSGTFNKVKVWKGESNGQWSCTGGGQCSKLFDQDKKTFWTGSTGSSVSVDFGCINFHEVVWFAKHNDINQSRYQGVCLYVDGVKVHCTSPTRYTVNGDRIIASAKGVVMNGVSNIEMRWQGSSEVAEFKIRYTDCAEEEKPADPNQVYRHSFGYGL